MLVLINVVGIDKAAHRQEGREAFLKPCQTREGGAFSTCKFLQRERESEREEFGFHLLTFFSSIRYLGMSKTLSIPTPFIINTNV